ncbi:hypothetical protein BTVI_106358 [Pitangus sulphuratus]|nr:hypothetical protein BTVI_106358 [Pitangus sulphuratus]
MPASSRTDFLPLAKAKPIRSNSNASVITYLRKESCCAERIPAREERSENIGTTRQTPRSVQKEGQEVLQALELWHLQPVVKTVVKTIVKQAVPLQPMEDHGGAETHLQPTEELMLEQVHA